LSLTSSKVDALEQQQAEEGYGMAFDSSTSGPESGTQSSHCGTVYSRVGLGIDVDEKPLPKLPGRERNKLEHTANGLYDTVCPQFDVGGETLETPSQLGFSFKSGDDADILAQSSARDSKPTSKVGLRTHQQSTTSSEGKSEASNTTVRNVEGSWQLKSTPVSYKPKIKSKLDRDSQDRELLQRDDSTSSIITALRDNSGRSSVDSSRQSSQGVRQKLNRNSGSNEAITAAVRALASASASARNSSRKGSSSGTREGSVKGEESPRIDEVDEVSIKSSQKTGSARKEV
jgi:hypothetical protein